MPSAYWLPSGPLSGPPLLVRDTEQDRAGQALSLETVWDFIEDAFKYSNEACLDISLDLTLKDFFHKKLAESSLSEDQKARVLLLGEMWGSFIGDSWERQSLRWFWLEECLDGENLYVMENHASIIQHVAAKVLTDATLHLSTLVTNITNLETTTTSNPKITVTTTNGTFSFDEVVVAVPLGCLKSNKPLFDPPLPPPILRAVANASYSSLEKVYIAFPTAFWDSPSSSEPFPSFAHFLHPEYVPASQTHFNIEMVPLSSRTIFGPAATPTLLLYTHDPCAAHVSSLIYNLPPTSREYFTVLNAFFRPYYSRLPNYVAEHADCTPVAILATDWHADDLAGNGAYTNFQVGGDDGADVRLDEDVRAMRAGMPERGVWFAGEHTAPFVALGTTTGAYWSGEMAGVKVLAAHGMYVAVGGGKDGKGEKESAT
ncbi:flavin-containing amine oxidase [Podospora appendiculata]|uniref:Flavin-containing amine oxidase n=1 Tax=Podospora appendiculata TaxID=314037 RepID=A0AAE0WYB2_9PEZI|nr:flavin-containing amine oxidase [Podospora appendiculata]KAK3680925.1 flavin-containing amine oxidase [Podospora appendiculata]